MRRLCIVVSALAVALGLWAPTGQAAPSPATPATARASSTVAGADGFVTRGGPTPAQRSTHVTLPTGDRVRVSELADGRRTVDVTPAAREGSPPSFHTIERGGDLRVIPEDVRSLVPSRLDPGLFNVTELVEQGYDDASYDSLPLIVSLRDGRRTRIPAVEVTTRLESIDSVGVRLDKDRAARFGTALTRMAEAAERGRTTRSSGPLAGVEKVWLDRRVRSTLDESAGQVGAPTAWNAGLDGSGVTVAVLDSGIDTAHEDLAGAVVGERNFTLTPTPSDGGGHGTHVASIIAGTGAASDGSYRGMADGVDLLSGKVLDDNGNGVISWAIDGMEWAAEQDADIVNMSLGAGGPGGQQLSDAVERLTAEHGTLFVAATGNRGCDACVSHPAAAESAVAVGAVDKSDALADFSNRGPLPDSYGIKPDVTAPGVDIVAARSADGTMPPPAEPVNEDYIRASGTSMAAPHVAGLAALMLQAEPDLGPAELKAWLTSSAEPQAGHTIYEQGAGRVDIERAIGSRVLATPSSVSFGHFPWPHEGRDPVSSTVTYRNLGGDDVALDLSFDVARGDGATPPAGTLTTSSSTVTVPAGGTASVDVVLDTARGARGLYGGYLRAAAADGTTVRTPVGYHQEGERVELRIRGIARDGRPARGSASILNVDDGSVDAYRGLDADPTVPCTDEPYSASTCVRVPPGTYSVLGYVDTMPSYAPPDDPGTPLNRSLVGYPEIEVTEDTEVVLDARKATEALVDTPDHDTKRNHGAAMEIMFHRAPEQGAAVDWGLSMHPGSLLQERLFMQPTDEVSTGEFAAYTRWRLEAPRITLDVTQPRKAQLHPKYYRAEPFSDNSRQFPLLDGELDAEIVDAGLGRVQDVAAVDLDGKVALIQRSDAIPVAEQSNNAADAGAKLVAIYNDVPGVNSHPWPANVRLQVPTTWISHEEGETVRAMLADGPARVAAHGISASPYTYELVYAEEGAIPDELHYVASTDRLARMDSTVHSQLAPEMTMKTTWYPFQPWQRGSMSRWTPRPGGPRTLVAYLTPDSSTRWSHAVETPEKPYNFIWPHEDTAHLHLSSRPQTYAAGQRYRRNWYEQPLAPGANPMSPPTRTGDIVEVWLGMLDSASHFDSVYSNQFEQGLATDFRLYRGDQYIDGTTGRASGWFRAEPEPTRYRIEYDIDNNATWAKLSTRTRSVWTFTTRRPADGEQRVEPILGVDYDFDVDLHNRAPHPRERKGPHRIELTFSHPDGAEQRPVDEVALAVSYDDGGTWRKVRHLVERGDNHYVATVRSGRVRGEFLSVKLSAADDRGNTLRQRVIRAYALARR